MNDKDKIADLAKQIEISFPKTSTKLDFFPSGSAMLDVRFHGRLFVFEYFSSESSFCVDELKEDEGFNTEYDFCTNNFDDAADKLKNILRSSISNG